jgi:hypothetical protein
MFSSNQILQISGDMSQLEMALQFALEYSGHIKNITVSERNRGCKLVFQITESGKYCIGWGLGEIPNNWSEYQFDFEVPIVAKIIEQHIKKLPVPDSGYDWADGSTSVGFIMKSVKETLGDDMDIKNAFFGIVYFEPYCNFYSK